MSRKFLFLIVILSLVMTACGQKNVDMPMTLVDHDKNEVTFPQDKPVVFFYMTAYT